MGILANENAISSGGYQIPNSLRFQSASSQYATRTPASAGNRQTWTWSGWVKLGTLGTSRPLFYNSNGATSNGHGGIYIESTNSLWFNGTDNGSAYTNAINTNAVFRDPSAWYHIVVVCDTTNATQANRQLIYINGVLQTCTVTQAITQNANLQINRNTKTDIGDFGYTGGTSYFDGYLSEVNFIDGQALTPSSFGETNTLTGQWVAKKYTGTYGTNGFYLPFSNGTSTTTLGNDSSGNGNNWTLTNFTRSAGVSDCWMYDVPSGNGGASGTQPNSNYAVLNPLWKGANITISAANLNFSSTGASSNTVQSTVLMSSGKWYCEWTQTNAGAQIVGIASDANTPSLSYPGQNTTSYGYSTSGNKYNNGATSYGATWTTNDVIGIAFDADAGTLTFYKNGVSQGTAFTGIPAGNYGFCFGNNPAATITGVINFGQRSFAQSVPSGYKALCTANLPVATIKNGNQYMQALLYTGNGVNNRTVTGVGFNPDLTWVKSRSLANSHVLADSVRGTNANIYSNLTNAETAPASSGGGGIGQVTTDGFTLVQGTASFDNSNGNTATYVAWNWKAGQGNNVSNTSGSITSTVSVNATAGFSVVTYTGTGANATVGHGLGVAPSMIICKCRTQVADWPTYHVSQGATKYCNLNSTSAFSTSSAPWNNTTPTSSVFTVGTSYGTNWPSNNMVAYCFAEIAGFSKFTSYTGNGSADGPFVYTGFRPKYVMIKISSAATDGWVIIDSSRSTYNVASNDLAAESSGAEFTTISVDFLSNGFKVRTTNSGANTNSATYIVMAFAENPLAQSNAR